MKKTFLFFVVILFSAVSLMAQSSKGFSFQGYARGADGSALQNESNLEVKFTIYSTDEGNPEFTESQTLNTDEFGVFQSVIGTVNSSTFNALNFSQKDFTLKVEVKDGGVYQQVARQSLLAVPYAKAAEKVQEGSNGVPAGSIMPFAGPTEKIPSGWLLCDGAPLTQSSYPNLYNAIGTAWGGSGSSFNLPDLRGQFLRGVSNETSNDPDRNSRTAKKSGGNTGDKVGSYQNDDNKSHNHSASSASAGSHSHSYNDYYWHDSGDTDDYGTPGGDDSGQRKTASRTTGKTGSHSHSITVNKTGGSESRPKNAYVNYIIKY